MSSSIANGRPRAVWGFPISYMVHLLEEYFAGEGFTEWAGNALAITMSLREFVIWNTLGFALVCVGTAMAFTRPRYRWIELALSTAVLGNAAAHVVASVGTGTYSPGLVSAVLIWVPLGIWRAAWAHRASSRRGRTAGLLVGLAGAFAPLLVMAF